MRKRKIDQLKKELKDLRELNEGAWDMWGSELCAGDMIEKERALEREIQELEDNENKKETLLELERKFQFAKTKQESDETLAKIIKLLPNDFDLGEYIRKLYSTKIS